MRMNKIKTVKYSKEVIGKYINKYKSEIIIPYNYNNQILKGILKDITYGEIHKAYSSFFKLDLFFQCVFFVRYGKPEFIYFY